MKDKFVRLYDKHYKLLLVFSLLLLAVSLIYIGNFYSKNNDFIYKDISLTGGTTVTVYDSFDVTKLNNDLSGKLENVNIRTIYDLITNEQKAVIIETTTDGDTTKKILEEYLGYDLNDENSSFEFTGASLGASFYKQLLIANVFAFILMALVVFALFRTFAPSFAVILAAFADIVMTLFVVDIIGLKLSSAGIIAFLMLIGYSVDTDILLTTRLLKREEGTLNRRIFNAFKTGITMTVTSLVAVLFSLFIVRSFSSVLTQIFTVLSIGLVFDIFNTWVTNAAMLKWYIERKEKQK